MNTPNQTPVISEETRFLANPDFMLREIAGEALLIPVGAAAQGNAMFPLNETGHFIWSLLQDALTMQEIIARANEAYDDPEGCMEQNIRDFILAHVRSGLILAKD
ncbi:MAG: PqqD family protein [Clostridiales bacterium]|nr:PqqD family protein [Clostridiales bacterium]